jgi:hypothetical protein
MSPEEKEARAAVRRLLKAGTYTMPAPTYRDSTVGLGTSIERDIARQMSQHHGVPVDRDSIWDRHRELGEEFVAFYQMARDALAPVYEEIRQVENERWKVAERERRAREQAEQAERNKDRPHRWWSCIDWRGPDARRHFIHDVGIRDDGSLWNPRNYPEADVRAAIAETDAQEAARKQEAIRQGVETRARRREKRIWQAADALRRGEGIGNHTSCYCCHKVLTDPVSITRGIGPECWEHVLQRVEWHRAQAEGAA